MSAEVGASNDPLIDPTFLTWPTHLQHQIHDTEFFWDSFISRRTAPPESSSAWGPSFSRRMKSEVDLIVLGATTSMSYASQEKYQDAAGLLKAVHTQVELFIITYGYYDPKTGEPWDDIKIIEQAWIHAMSAVRRLYRKNERKMIEKDIGRRLAPQKPRAIPGGLPSLGKKR